MKKFKKLASTALAMAMVLSMGTTAFAAPGDKDVDESITVSGLQDGDKVSFYQVLEWKDGWVPTGSFSGVLSEDELKGLVKGHVVEGEDGGAVTEAGGITFELAGKLGANASSAAQYGDPVNANNGNAVVNMPAAGLYMAIITPGQPGYTYNPVFVAADFSRANNNGVVDLSDGALGYADKGHAKVNKIDVEKTADSITSDVGDEVGFTVVTMIPLYADNYVKPVFKLTDVLSAGLVLDGDSIVVTDANGAVVTAYDKTITEDGYILDFNESYLRELDAAMQITVTYKAVVDIEDPTNVSFEDNTVTVNFSNRPDDTIGAGILRDKTNHYTFDIDGSLFGQGEYTTSDIVKIGVDANGNEIKSEKLSNGKWAGVLTGAKFKLYTDEACQNEYTNPWMSANLEDGTIVSDELGHITMKGLDAGDYWLLETEAPAGYIKAAEAVHISIEAIVERDVTVEETETVEIGGESIEVPVVYTADVLTGYRITVNGHETASYTLVNNATQDLESVVAGDIVGNEGQDDNDPDGIGKIQNIVGVELPSTGGMGTTIFYVLGATLVIGAGVLLVVKKRVGDKD